jgi:hypothetical protein
MSSGVDYIPRADGKLSTWAQFLFETLDAKYKAWGIDPLSFGLIYPTLIQAFADALAKLDDPNHGPADTAAKNAARKELVDAIRPYVKEYLEYNHMISDADRTSIGLPVHDTDPTRVPVPDSWALPTVNLEGPGVIKIFVTDSKSGKRAKPEGVHGYEIGYTVSAEHVANWDELLHSGFSTGNAIEFSFESEKRGLIFSFATRYENSRGEKGPWSEIIHVIIP